MKDAIGQDGRIFKRAYWLAGFVASGVVALTGCSSNQANTVGDPEENYSHMDRRLNELERKIDTQNARQNQLVSLVRDSVTTWLDDRSTREGGHTNLLEYARILSEEIYFHINEFALSESDKSILDNFAMLMAEHPSSLLQVTGHADRTGQSFYNHQLSEQRAESVRRFLVQKYDIPLHRMAPLGFGEEIQKYPNDTSSERNKNRRVEVHLLMPKNLIKESGEALP